MKKIKNRIGLSMLLTVILAFVIFTAAFQIGFRVFFRTQATLAIENEINYEQTYETDWRQEFFTGMVQFFYVDQKYTTDQEDSFYGDGASLAHQNLLDYCQKNRDTLEPDTIYHATTDGSHYFFAITDMNYTEDQSEYLEETDTIPQYEIIYLDLTPFITLCNILMILAVILMIILGLIMSRVGTRLGKKIEQAEEQQAAFFQNASHELKTPLMSIQGYAEGMEAGVIDSHKATTVILEESERMSNLVEEILCLSKVDGDHLKLKKEPLDIKELLYDCLLTIEPTADKRHLTLTPDFPEEDLLITGDEAQLRKAFLNPLSNACRYASTEIRVDLQIRPDSVTVTISDDGPDMDADTLSHLFERFYTGPHGNTGIGLALSKEIIRLHQGTIQAKRENDHTLIVIGLPR